MTTTKTNTTGNNGNGKKLEKVIVKVAEKKDFMEVTLKTLIPKTPEGIREHALSSSESGKSLKMAGAGTSRYVKIQLGDLPIELHTKLDMYITEKDLQEFDKAMEAKRVHEKAQQAEKLAKENADLKGSLSDMQKQMAEMAQLLQELKAGK